MSEVASSLFDFLHGEVVKYYGETKATDKLEMLGFRVGFQLIERHTRERGRFSDTLETIKFICKEFWIDVFHKQIDNLRTNHKGTFVLQDHKFRFLTQISASNAPKHVVSTYLFFTAGLIRGALANLDIMATVVAESTALPSCSFTIKVAS
eukprot:c9937_g1_i1.p1 GENE.c9937_g1_i1~~c9937_g1_i1.p1  ORF type:complete len:151 (+),score=31.51 c9937_g1_i1:53-505(+)